MSAYQTIAAAVEACLEAGTYAVEREQFDFDTFAEAARDVTAQEAETACIYYATCMDIISAYESEYRSDADDYGQTFRPSDWQQAMTAYAMGVARAAIDGKLEEALEEIEEAAEALAEGAHGADVFLARDCPYGWLAHQSMSPAGVCFWRDVEGVGPAWAIECGAGWLYTKAGATVGEG